MKVFALIAILALVSTSVYAGNLNKAPESDALDSLLNELELIDQELDQQAIEDFRVNQVKHYWTRISTGFGKVSNGLNKFGQFTGTVGGMTAVFGPNNTVGRFGDKMKRLSDFTNVFTRGRGSNGVNRFGQVTGTIGGVAAIAGPNNTVGQFGDQMKRWSDFSKVISRGNKELLALELPGQDTTDQSIEDINFGTFYRKAVKSAEKISDIACKIAVKAVRASGSGENRPDIEALQVSAKELQDAAKEYKEEAKEGFDFLGFMKSTLKYSERVIDVAYKAAVVAGVIGGIAAKYGGKAAGNTVEALQLGNYFKEIQNSKNHKNDD